MSLELREKAEVAMETRKKKLKEYKELKRRQRNEVKTFLVQAVRLHNKKTDEGYGFTGTDVVTLAGGALIDGPNIADDDTIVTAVTNITTNSNVLPVVAGVHSTPGNRIDLNVKRYTTERKKHGKNSRKRGTFFGTYTQNKADDLQKSMKEDLPVSIEEKEEDTYDFDDFEEEEEKNNSSGANVPQLYIDQTLKHMDMIKKGQESQGDKKSRPINEKKYTLDRQKHGAKSRKRGTFFGMYDQSKANQVKDGKGTDVHGRKLYI